MRTAATRGAGIEHGDVPPGTLQGEPASQAYDAAADDEDIRSRILHCNISC